MLNKTPNSSQSPYQSVLNQYSKSKPQPEPDSPLSPQSPAQKIPSKTLQNSLPNSPSGLSHQPIQSKVKQPIVTNPSFSAKDHNKPKQSLPKIDPSTTTPSSAPKNPFKQIFFLSLFIFLVILGSIILSFFQQSQKPKQTIVATPTPIKNISPPSLPEDQEFCVINDQQYQVSETFLSADGCNLCTCLPSLIISCTNNDCRE